MPFVPRVSVPTHPLRPAWIVPRDELVDYTHKKKVPFYPECSQLLEAAFDRAHFLPRQIACINCAIQGYDLIINLPTSSGKSLCYQLPAIYNSAITLVVSPTKTLIEDQIRTLHALDLQWKLIAQRSHSENRYPLKAEREANGPLRLFYICPEWFDNAEHLRTLYSLCEQNHIARVVVDEVHNAVQGLSREHRCAYAKVFELRQLFPRIPFTLVSASLKIEHQKYLTSALDAQGKFFSVSSPGRRRKNFAYRVVHIGSGSHPEHRDFGYAEHSLQTLKLSVISTYLSKHPTSRGFVFVPTRKLARIVAEKLQEMDGSGAGGSRIEWFHAGEGHRLSDILARFNAGQISVLVCTSTFGEGINNKLMDFVFHYSMPPSMIRYFQETGRVGRNGQQAECILLYSFSDILSVVNVIAHDIPSTHKHKVAIDRVLLPSQRAELQEVLEFCTNSFSCRHKQMFDMFESLLPLATDPAQGTSTERFAELYARATSNTRAEGKRQESADTLVEDDSARKGVDENCGSCDVCDRRYGPPEVHEQGSIDEPDNFQLITNEEIEIIENAFRNDISVPFAELVKRVSASNDARLKGRRARDTIEFLAVSGVLKMRFEHIYSRNATRFSTKLEKGSTKIDEIHRPLPVPYTALGPLVLPVRPRKVAKPKPRDDTSMTTSDDTSTTITSDDEGDTRIYQLWAAQEDGYGTRLSLPLRPSRKRGRSRSSSFELPDPPPPRSDLSRHVQNENTTPSVSPRKRRKVGSAAPRGNLLGAERDPTELTKMLNTYYAAAAKRGKDGEELFMVSKETLKRLFGRHGNIVDEDDFVRSLKEAKASEEETAILLPWHGWIISHIFANRFTYYRAREGASP